MSTRVGLATIALLTWIACATPPDKEMGQAEGAIDAARAAGAEQYASEELGAAVLTLEQSREAVSLRDYRSALSYAIDSRQRAQTAARLAAEQRAALQSQAERALTELRVLIERGEERVAAAEARRGARSTVQIRGALAHAVNAMQEASAAMARGDYAAVTRRLAGVQAEVTTALTDMP